MAEPSERDREMALICVERMHPIGTALDLEPQAEHVAIYIAAARAEERERCACLADDECDTVRRECLERGEILRTQGMPYARLAARIRSGQ